MEALQALVSHQQNSLQPSTALYVKYEEQFLLLGLPKVLFKLGWWLLHGLSTHHVLPLFYKAISLLYIVFLSLSSASVAEVLIWRANICLLGHLQTRVPLCFLLFLIPFKLWAERVLTFLPHFITVIALLPNSVSSWMKHGDHQKTVHHQGNFCLHPLRHTIRPWLLDLSKDWGDLQSFYEHCRLDSINFLLFWLFCCLVLVQLSPDHHRQHPIFLKRTKKTQGILLSSVLPAKAC